MRTAAIVCDPACPSRQQHVWLLAGQVTGMQAAGIGACIWRPFAAAAVLQHTCSCGELGRVQDLWSLRLFTQGLSGRLHSQTPTLNQPGVSNRWLNPRDP